MPDENRVFDVTKPSHVNPTATSKPVIVGHHPMVSDPTVKDQSEDDSGPGYILSQPTRITVDDQSESEHHAETVTPPDTGPPAESETSSSSTDVPPAEDAYKLSEPSENLDSTDTEPPAAVEPAAETAAPEESPSPLADPFAPPTEPQPEPTNPPFEPLATPQPHIEGLHVAGPPRRRRWPKYLLVLLVLLIAAYLIIDSGLVGSSINLPFHIFKQKTNPPASSSTNTSTNNTASTPSVPAGFKEYSLSGTPITFAAPIAWGDPSSSPEAGYSKRGGTNQSDGTYAYLVNFATNKDIQIAVTSSKYLPAARATQYYDYLQWCTGTNDGQIYESVLHFTTANKVDTPTTITCDQGPVAGAVKLDATTIVQAKAEDTSNKVIGDIYTKNLTDSSLVVFRVKDAATTNGDNIKQLLSTIQLNSSSSQ